MRNLNLASSVALTASVGLETIVRDALATAHEQCDSGIVETVGDDLEDVEEALDGSVEGDWEDNDFDQSVGRAIAKGIRRAVRRGGKRRRGSKIELLPIAETTLTAGQSTTIEVKPTRAMKLCELLFDPRQRDHGWITLTAVEQGGANEINGTAGIFLSLITPEDPMELSGKRLNGGDIVYLKVTNTDSSNSRKLRGFFRGPSA